MPHSKSLTAEGDRRAPHHANDASMTPDASEGARRVYWLQECDHVARKNAPVGLR